MFEVRDVSPCITPEVNIFTSTEAPTRPKQTPSFHLRWWARRPRYAPLTDRFDPLTDRYDPLTHRYYPLTDRYDPLTDRFEPLTDRLLSLTLREK